MKFSKKFVLPVLLMTLVCNLSSVRAVNDIELNVWEVDLNFCNGGNKLHLDMEAWTSNEICMNIRNISTKPGTISLHFVDGEMSQGETPIHACKTSADWLFGKNTLLSGTDVISLGALEEVQRTATVSIPTGFAGDLFGCVAYVVTNPTTSGNGWQMISIVSRKANTISVSVKWTVTSNIYMEDVWAGLGNNPMIHIAKNGDGTYTANIKLTNKWSISEEIFGSIYIDDGLTYSKSLPIITKTQVYPEETKEFKVELWKLPIYGWQYTFTLQLEHTPINIDGKPLGSSVTLSQVANYSFGILKYGILPVLWWVFLLLIILYFIERPYAIRRRAKKLAKKAEKKAKKIAEAMEKKHQHHK